MDTVRVTYSTKQNRSLPLRFRVFAALTLTATVVGCGPGDRDTTVGSTAEEVIGGFPATSAKLNAIGAIGIDNGNNGFTPFCTGTLISPTMVLTAKHCVNAADPTKLAFLIGPNAMSPIRVVPARGAAVEPTLSGGTVELGSDVGILHLALPVTDIAPLPTAPLTNDRIGTRMLALGYGVQNTDLTRGTRQSGSMTLKATAGPVLAAIFGTFNNFLQRGAARLFPDLDPNDPAQLAELQQQFDNLRLIDGIEAWFGAGPGDAQACTGDGGGPMTAKVGTQTTVFGVSSWGFGENETCTLDGSSFASMNAVSLDFVDYETQCPLIPRAGVCDGLTVAVRCADVNEGGRRELRTDCAEIGQICGVNENNALACIDDPCDGLPPGGTCSGDVVTRCSVEGEGARRVVTTDCAAQGQQCTIDDGTAVCVTPAPVCAHDECVTGGALDANCDTCVGSICTVDAFCCNTAWDGICVGEVATVCHQACLVGGGGEVSPLRP